jgi:hypothetical protein
MFYALALCDDGRTEAAIREGQAAIDSAPGDSVMLYNGACLYGRLGEKQRAIDTLAQAIAAGVRNFGWMTRDPDLDSLRNEPEFIELMNAATPKPEAGV